MLPWSAPTHHMAVGEDGALVRIQHERGTCSGALWAHLPRLSVVGVDTRYKHCGTVHAIREAERGTGQTGTGIRGWGCGHVTRHARGSVRKTKGAIGRRVVGIVAPNALPSIPFT